MISQINDLSLLIDRDNFNPHAFLGLHDNVIRLWRPGADEIYIQLNGKSVKTEKVHPVGLFEYTLSKPITFKDYQVYHQNGNLAYDPYCFLPTVGEIDQYLFGKGVHYELYKVLGAKITEIDGIKGTKFAVWAPSAKSVSLVADFNFFDGRINPMRACGHSGIWELFVPGLHEGEKYKFEIKTQTGQLKVKADPYAFQSEMRPATASVVADNFSHSWNDQHWMANREQNQFKPQPMTVYEVHLGSWKKKGDSFLNYRDIAKELVSYCQSMGFTHVELMPIQEHPLDESWGYQVSGFYSVTSRFGTPKDFQWFVDYLHQNSIGIILDWVPGHFPTDDFSLGRFDGTALYEHEDPRQGFHPHWNTHIFNFGRFEITNFLIANALYWFDAMHIDGLRVDAVASMLYLDYGREQGEWIPNIYGGKENLAAIEFIKHLNSITHQRHKGILMIAEESTSFAGVTKPVHYGGLGFDLKWNMGWMNDTLRYFAVDPLYRTHHHNDLTFGLLYAFSERFMLVLSHDEVVHGKNSLMGKMPGDQWQQFANMRLLYSYMICQPGKKLLFMGGEIGQWNEWSCSKEIEWFLLQFPIHHALQTAIRDINHLYLENSPLWEKDFEHQTFEWVDFQDRKNSVISYLRKSSQGTLLCVHNFTPSFLPEYYLPIKNLASIHEIWNSDSTKYGGSGKENHNPFISQDSHGFANGLKIQLAPLSTMIFKIAFWS